MKSTSPDLTTGAIIALNTWAERAGLSPCTLWRWRKRGWLKTRNIAGRQYLTSEDLREFEERLKRGEFAQQHKTPARELKLAAKTETHE
jgi:hypothetical protein